MKFLPLILSLGFPGFTQAAPIRSQIIFESPVETEALNQFIKESSCAKNVTITDQPDVTTVKFEVEGLRIECNTYLDHGTIDGRRCVLALEQR